MAEKPNIESELKWIKGVGPKRAEVFAEEGVTTIKDVVLYFPRSYIDRNANVSLKSLLDRLKYGDLESKTSGFFNTIFHREETVVAQITSIQEKQFGKKKLLSLSVKDSFGGIARVNFWNRVDYFKKLYSVGQILAISGKPEYDDFNKCVSFTHPDIDVIEAEDASLYGSGAILPKYRMSENLKRVGVNMPLIRKIVQNSLDSGNYFLRETLPDFLLSKYGLPKIQVAIKNLHFPENKLTLEKSRFRIKYEEALFYQLAINSQKKALEARTKGFTVNPKSELARRVYDSLPFELTKDQKKVIREVADDMSSGRPMNRLLQGDVGSGKTVVALLTALMAIDNGFQVVFMAPTEILAEQHLRSIKKFFEKENLVVTNLVGGQKTKMRREVLEEIGSGKSNIIVGTHALFQSEVKYKNLGLVIIDEQHRFGVEQRGDLIKLAKESYEDPTYSPHILVMTATPIPRTLTMTVYGDLDVSVIKEAPKNRKPIKTKVAFESSRESIYDFIKDEIRKGRQAYIVYPLVEKSDKLELKAAVEHFEEIKTELFPDFKCGLLHGQMLWYEKEDAMNAFLNKEYDILVATTVIEVGIDVPNASVMLIENAERFGLSQLHQLRGRVGRGSEQSYCILMTKDNFKYLLKRNSDPETERLAAIIRLKTMEETTDGFQISEVDLKLRGPGDIMGAKQSGLPEFKYVDLVADADIISSAKRDAEEILKQDPHLRLAEHNSLRLRLGELYHDKNMFLGIA